MIADGARCAPCGAATRAQLGYVLVERQQLRDPRASSASARRSARYLTLSGGAISTWHARARPPSRDRRHRAARRSFPRCRCAPACGPARRRSRGRRGARGVDLAPVPSRIVTPAARLDVVRTAPTPMTVGPDAYAGRTAPGHSCRARASRRGGAVTDDVAVKASAGWYVRLPTLLELFGNRGTIVGSPDLRPERGPSLDAGVVWAPARGFGRCSHRRSHLRRGRGVRRALARHDRARLEHRLRRARDERRRTRELRRRAASRPRGSRARSR